MCMRHAITIVTNRLPPIGLLSAIRYGMNAYEHVCPMVVHNRLAEYERNQQKCIEANIAKTMLLLLPQYLLGVATPTALKRHYKRL